MDKKKLVFLVYSLGYGGAERVICNLANNYVDKYNIEILTLVDVGISYDLNKNINVIQFGNKTETSFLKKIKNSIRVVKYLKQIKPDIIVSFCPTMCYVVCFSRIFISALKKSKLIISERNDPNSEYKNILIKGITNFLYNKSDIVVFQTDDAKSFFNKKIQKKGVIIPNPINEKFINYNAKFNKNNIIINVGRLEPQKNQELLIRAFSKIKDKIPNYELYIYGDGNLKEYLEKLIISLNCTNKIKLMGKSAKIEEELSKSKIFVMSSNYEGMPNSLMEAMSLGLACISTDCPCGGPKSLIKNNKNGILIPVNSQIDIEKSLLYLINNPNMIKNMGEEAKKVVKDYNPQKIYEKWDHIL